MHIYFFRTTAFDSSSLNGYIMLLLLKSFTV